MLLACIVGVGGLSLFPLETGKTPLVLLEFEAESAFDGESESSDGDVLQSFFIAEIAVISRPQIYGLCVVQDSDSFQALVARVHFDRGPPLC